MTPRAVVSGGTGFVGRFIVERLLADGFELVVLGRNAPADGFFSRPVTFLEADLEPGNARLDLFYGASIFVHAAFDHLLGRYRGGEGEDAAGFRRRNLDGTVALFRAAKEAGVSRAIFLSSRAVYGTQPPGLTLTEETVCRPDTLYGEVKLEAERALAAMADDAFRTASLRVTGVYGAAAPGQAHKWHRLIDDWRAGRPIPPRVGTEVHGVDVAAAVATALAALDAGDRHLLLNVSDIAVDHADIVAILNAQAGWQVPLPERGDSSTLNMMATDRLRALGWTPGGTALLAATLGGFLHE